MITVTNTNDAGAGSLRQAILDASVGEEITFSITGTIILTSAELLITQGVIITGPGSGSLTVDGGGAFRVFNVSSGVVSLTGLTISFGFSSQGGGIHNEATLTLDDVIVSDCTSSDEGGGIYNTSAIKATDLTVKNCVATTEGGGIWNTGSIGNTYPDPWIGGAVMDNAATGNGGGIWNDASLSMSRVDITGNDSTTGADGGGGVYTEGTCWFYDLTIGNNTAFGSGDGVRNVFGSITFTRCTVGPHANIGAYNRFGTFSLENCTVSGNTGTGLYNELGAFDIKHSTITQNTYGLTQDSGPTLEIFDTILSGNTAGDYDGETADVTSGGHNIFGNDTNPVTPAAGDQIVLNFAALMMGDLQDNGGPTFTHELLAGSPALDAGDNTDAPSTDQRGEPRIVNTTIDIGAFEADVETPPEVEADPVEESAELDLGITGEFALIPGPPEQPPEPPAISTPVTVTTEPCTPTLEAAVTVAPCTPEGTFETPVVAPCTPLTFQPTNWFSLQCYTAECPPEVISYILGEGGEYIFDEFGNRIVVEYSVLGAIGDPVTRCASATSDISQADADARALALAQAAAEAALVCQFVPLLSDQAELMLEIFGSYDAIPIIELAELVLDLRGEYEVAAPEDEAELELSITGEYVILPIEESVGLVLTMGPLSEYRLETLFDFAALNLDVLGSYSSTIIFTPDVVESASVTMTLSGVYSENTQAVIASDSAAVSLASLSGVYALVAVTPPDQTSESTLTLGFSAEYLFRVIVLPERQFSMTLGLGLTGVYA